MSKIKYFFEQKVKIEKIFGLKLKNDVKKSARLKQFCHFSHIHKTRVSVDVLNTIKEN